MLSTSNRIALNPDVPNPVVKDLIGQAFPVAAETKTLVIYYGRVLLTAAFIFRERINAMQQTLKFENSKLAVLSPFTSTTLRNSTFVSEHNYGGSDWSSENPATTLSKKDPDFRPIQPIYTSPNRPTKRKVGQPHPDWAQTPFTKIYQMTRVDGHDF